MVRYVEGLTSLGGVADALFWEIVDCVVTSRRAHAQNQLLLIMLKRLPLYLVGSSVTEGIATSPAWLRSAILIFVIPHYGLQQPLLIFMRTIPYICMLLLVLRDPESLTSIVTLDL